MIAEEIEKLLQLQGLDNEILKRQIEIDLFPEKVKILNKEIEDIENQIKIQKEDLRKIQLDRRERELEVKSYEEELKNLNKKLDGVKDNKEYEALLIEIANNKKKISEIEDDILLLMEKEDDVLKKLKILEEELKKAKEKVSKIIEEEKKKIENLKIEVELKKREREDIVKDIDYKMYVLYEKIRESKKDKIAVVKIENGICSGCYMKLPTFLVEKVKKKKEIIQCENCSRILF
ncbi:MAG: C4-type zinc ribbon domain-containing protein [Candidatus Omnitrophica bacterium]|nr:C4-type zinc ribbon domain-containing protein [Candidatus Omnitrophota bacterium]MCM8802216.1 C4-type zinc ribbon domain-containing protein [Candidatus Omnitrophota bacterium]